jgi:hexosaminidase
LGGDEVIYGCWANDSSIVDWMAVNGTQYGIAPGDYDALLSYFVSKAQALAANHGFSQPTQWEEVFKAGCDVTPNTVYQVWTGAQYVGACTAANYAVVASPSSYWYLDHADNTASVMYDYDPSVDLSDAQQALLLGGEVNMWGEHVDEHNHDAITWPRAAAVAERLWSSSQVQRLSLMFLLLRLCVCFFSWEHFLAVSIVNQKYNDSPIVISLSNTSHETFQ